LRLSWHRSSFTVNSSSSSSSGGSSGSGSVGLGGYSATRRPDKQA